MKSEISNPVKIALRSKSAISRLPLLMVLAILTQMFFVESKFVLGQYPDFEAVDPYPAIGKTKELYRINFTGNNQADQWQPLHNVELKRTPEGLLCSGTEDDPYFQSPAFSEEISQKLTGSILINISLRSESLKSLEIFWSDKEEGGYHPKRSARSSKIVNNNQWQNCLVEINAKAPITRLRIDPGSKGQSVEIRSITFCRINLPLMQIIGWNTNNGTLSLDLKITRIKLVTGRFMLVARSFLWRSSRAKSSPLLSIFLKRKCSKHLMFF